jgi:uncharacterized membrane protein
MTDSTPTGLSDNSAGALAYVTFIPAIVFLAMPPYNQSPYVRFHAWQSIFLFVAWIVLWIAMVIIAMVTVFFAPFLVTILYFLLGLGFFALWIVCVVQALNGKRFMVPIIGALAAKQAGV